MIRGGSDSGLAGQFTAKQIREVAGQARHDSREVGEKEIPAQGRNLPEPPKFS